MEEKFNLKRGVIFDLDGTMWDSSEAVTAAYNRSLERVGLDIRLSRSDVMAVMGKTMTEIAHIYFDAIDPNRAEDIMLDCIEEENEYLKTHCGEVYDGLEDTLRELGRRGYFLACVSNCQSGYIEAFYAATGLGKYFKDKECWGGTGLEKAGNIRLVVERNGLESAVYVGDTLGDYNATMAAGQKFIHAAYGFGSVPEGTPAISSIKELPEALELLEDR